MKQLKIKSGGRVLRLQDWPELQLAALLAKDKEQHDAKTI